MSYNSVSPRLIKTIAEEFSDKKFTDADIYDSIDDAIRYMRENIEFNSANDFIQAMWKAYGRYGSLTNAQIRGLLNCIRAEVLAADKQAQQTIDQMTSGKEPLDLRSVLSGSYAVPHGDNETAFYVIDNIKDEKSKWNGWVFVNILSSDTKLKVGSQRPNQNYQGQHESLLREIKNDPYKAATLFGHLIGRCGICGRTLTDPESIERGIGPICAEKVGWIDQKDLILKSLGLRD